MKFIKKIQYTNEQEAIKSLKKALQEYKVVVLEQVGSSIDLHELYTRISDQIGSYVNSGEDNVKRTQTEERWISISYDPEVQNRYRTAKVHQPLHTDDSYIPHNDCITFFYCVSQAAMGGATTFIDSRMLVQALEEDSQTELLTFLKTQDVCFEKGSLSKTQPILIEKDGDYKLNYNYFCLSENSDEHTKEMVERFQVFLENRVRGAGLPSPVLLKPREAVFFHDSLLLHGRNSYFATKKGERTLIKGSLKIQSS